jgi:hypothetical protein
MVYFGFIVLFSGFMVELIIGSLDCITLFPGLTNEFPG